MSIINTLSTLEIALMVGAVLITLLAIHQVILARRVSDIEKVASVKDFLKHMKRSKKKKFLVFCLIACLTSGCSFKSLPDAVKACPNTFEERMVAQVQKEDLKYLSVMYSYKEMKSDISSEVTCLVGAEDETLKTEQKVSVAFFNTTTFSLAHIFMDTAANGMVNTVFAPYEADPTKIVLDMSIYFPLDNVMKIFTKKQDTAEVFVLGNTTALIPREEYILLLSELSNGKLPATK